MIDVDSELPAERRAIAELTANDLLADDRVWRRAHGWVETNAGERRPMRCRLTSAATNVKAKTGKNHRYLVQPWYRDPIAHEREQAR